MCYREDFYKFIYTFLPHTVFNYGRYLFNTMTIDGELFIENLKRTWSIMELDKPELRADPPSFAIDIVNFNSEHTGIILSIPEARERFEAAYIGITYDKNGNFRYFTYEIGRGRPGETLYFLCEITADSEHYNYICHTERDKSIFIETISELLVLDLL